MDQKYRCRDMSPLDCGDQYNNEVVAQIFPNMHQQLILRIPLLKQENPTSIGDKVKLAL